MPELPEVETIRRGLSQRIIGKKIIDIVVLNPKTFQGDPDAVIGTQITEVERRAKLIRIKLSNDLNLLFHLKLTGQLIHEHPVSHLDPPAGGERSQEISRFTRNDKNNMEIDFAGGHPSHDWHAKLPNSNTRIIFTFDDNSKLFFNDLRKFGWCRVLTNEEIDEIYRKEYGLEPLDEKFDVNYLLAKAKNIPNRNIKQFLMDQTIAAGMGNIYTDETLFDAKISPLRKIKNISMTEWRQLISSMRKVLELGIKFGGTTDSDYVNAEGKKGGMQDHLKVYHQTGKPCPNSCGGKVERITIGGRGTHYCSNCQK